MPQLIALALVGAGVYAGYRWVSRQMAAAREAAARAEAEQARTAAEASGEPKDLGKLEWDATARVYRPRPGAGA